MGVNDSAARIPFAQLVRQTSFAIANGQMALDWNAVVTAQRLADTTFSKGSVILAIVETVDGDGNVTKVETLENDKELSLLAWGLYPTFYNFAETTIDMRFSAYMHKREYTAEREYDYQSNYASSIASSIKSSKVGGGLSLNLGIFKVGGGGGSKKTETKSSYESELSVSSASSVAQSSTYQGESIYCRLQTLLKPKDPPDLLVPQVIRKVEEGGQ